VNSNTEQAHIPTVLIVDRDLGFVFWLGQALDQAGYRALPAKSCEDAVDLLKEMPVEIDVLILGNSCAGAQVFPETLRRSQRCLKVIVAVGDWEELSPPFPAAHAVQQKFSSRDETSKLEWLETIQTVLSPDCSVN
jgi:ActR/RegA family two-component response regulator